jgi:bifunctional non-homologous end joining protein LigD
MSLAEYKKKRNFRATPEPVAAERRAGQRRFVVQKHAATRLHFDFRLELGRTLKSWAIPKGLPMVKGEKRLAVQVEDHPVSYRTFEGTIPRGQYGGGTVMVWDSGTYHTEEPHPLKALAAGKLHVTLHGQKLRGSWHLVRMRGEPNQWLIIRGEAGPGAPRRARESLDKSVLSGRTMEEIAAGAEDAARETKVTSQARKRGKNASARRLTPLELVPPMLALLVNEPPPGRWLYEIKFDGYRAIAYKEGATVRLVSRNGIDLTTRFPVVAEALQAVDAERAIIDGELVALDRDGRPSFQRLHRPNEQGAVADAHFYAFDLLHIDGEALLTKPLSKRRARLERALSPCPDTIRFSAALEGDVTTLLAKARALELEGLIGKRVGSPYEPGLRSGAWIKLKLTSEHEFVIGGYTLGAGSRSHFGALLLGLITDGELRYVGKVGTGFDEGTRRVLHGRLTRLERRTSPFQGFPSGESKAALAGIRWVDPELVCQVRFSEWTNAGRLRHPVFLGLREDKAPGDVVHERARPATRRRRR